MFPTALIWPATLPHGYTVAWNEPRKGKRLHLGPTVACSRTYPDFAAARAAYESCVKAFGNATIASRLR
ncbi:MAG TPA: hypothetical protein VHT52_17130 [Stellaceae bacterium]|jgi:hypothetical protein|nr:hypothetical protein [Stellaceae bacterium]